MSSRQSWNIFFPQIVGEFPVGARVMVHRNGRDIIRGSVIRTDTTARTAHVDLDSDYEVSASDDEELELLQAFYPEHPGNSL